MVTENLWLCPDTIISGCSASISSRTPCQTMRAQRLCKLCFSRPYMSGRKGRAFLGGLSQICVTRIFQPESCKTLQLGKLSTSTDVSTFPRTHKVCAIAANLLLTAAQPSLCQKEKLLPASENLHSPLASLGFNLRALHNDPRRRRVVSVVRPEKLL